MTSAVTASVCLHKPRVNQATGISALLGDVARCGAMRSICPQQPRACYRHHARWNTCCNMDMDVDEDDVLVETLNVYVAKGLEQQLHVLQYPLRHQHDEFKAPRAARVKPKVNVLELELPIETRPDHYDEERGQNYGRHHTTIDNASGGRLNSQILVSSVVPPKTHYFAGVVRDGQLHLTAIKTTLQMRPSLEYLDRLEAQTRTDTGDVEGEGPEEEEDDNEKDEETKAIQVQFKKRESERALAARKRSHAYLQKQVEDDPWVNLAVNDEQSDDADATFENMIAQSLAPVTLGTAADVYMRSLCPPPVQPVLEVMRRPPQQEPKTEKDAAKAKKPVKKPVKPKDEADKGKEKDTAAKPAKTK